MKWTEMGRGTGFPRCSKIQEELRPVLLHHFVRMTPARIVAEELELNRNTVMLFFKKVRELISHHLDDQFERLPLEAKLGFAPLKDDREFKKKRVGMNGEVPMFGVLAHNGKSHLVSIPEEINKSTQAYLSHNDVDCGWLRYGKVEVFNTLDLDRINDCRKKFGYLTNGVDVDADSDSWWIDKLPIEAANFHLRQYHGIPSSQFSLFMKEALLRERRNDFLSVLFDLAGLSWPPDYIIAGGGDCSIRNEKVTAALFPKATESTYRHFEKPKFRGPGIRFALEKRREAIGRNPLLPD